MAMTPAERQAKHRAKNRLLHPQPPRSSGGRLLDQCLRDMSTESQT